MQQLFKYDSMRNISLNAQVALVFFSAYNKKQEFLGGKTTVNKYNCQTNQVFQQINSLVEFIQ
jgi:hypothetical protein